MNVLIYALHRDAGIKVGPELITVDGENPIVTAKYRALEKAKRFGREFVPVVELTGGTKIIG